MKKVLIFVLAVFLFAGALQAAPLRDGVIAADPVSSELILLHTNDYHGNTVSNNGRGGLAEIAAYVKAVKLTHPQVILLDAGDINTGSAISNMFDAEPDILAYNMMGYDAVVFGNHEFDGAKAKLDRQISIAGFPFVSSNIKTANGSFLGGNQYVVKQYDNFKVGIFGITTTRTKTIASPDSSLVFLNEIDAARDVVDILRNKEKADIVIGLTHLGSVKETPENPTSAELAAAVDGIDIIIDGHSHTFMEAPQKEGSTWIVSANEWGKYVGHGRLTVKGGKLAGFHWVPVAIQPDREVAEMLKPYLEKAAASLKEVIGEAADTFVFGSRLPRYQETALGNLITDANAWYLKNFYSHQEVDFVFHNGGNIRAELPKGPLTQEQILTVLPFENYLYTAAMKGSQITDLFNFIAGIAQGSGGFPQFSSEVRYTIDKSASPAVVKDLTIGGQPVDPDKTYRFCTNDYILGGGDGYEVMAMADDKFNTSLLLSYVVTEYIKAQKVIQPATDGRLTVIGGVSP
jgi:5'-nucleotidase/UDP-sugar diphosphatase